MNTKEDLKRDINTLEYNVSHALDTLHYIQSIQAGEIIGKFVKGRREILQRLIDYNLLECHRLFDETPGTLSFRGIGQPYIDVLGRKAWHVYLDEKLRAFQEKHTILERIKNHRHIKIAHLQREQELGFGPEATATLNLFFEESEWLTPVGPDFVHVTSSNFPGDDILKMLNDLRVFLADELLKPLVEKYPF